MPRLVGCALVTAVLFAGSAARPTAAPIVEHRVVVVSRSLADERIAVVREALAFWNRTLTEMELRVRLVETVTTISPSVVDALENYTRRIWQLAGRLRPGMPGPPSPPELRYLDGDVVVFLSVQPTMSFAWPLEGATRHFVPVPAEPGSRSSRAGSTRNIMAHELGHTLGLAHQRNPLVLMCSPCRPTLGQVDGQGFLPLTAVDRRRLRRRFGAGD